MNFIASYDVPVESEEQLREMLGEQYTPDAGPVTVDVVGTQIGEICSLTITGSLPAIISWLDAMSLDSESLLRDVATMITDGDIKIAG